MKFVAPSSSDEGQYLISLVVPQSDLAKKVKKSRPTPPGLQIIPIKTEVEKASRKKVRKDTSASSGGGEDVSPDSAMVEREAMAIFRDYMARIGTIKLCIYFFELFPFTHFITKIPPLELLPYVLLWGALVRGVDGSEPDVAEVDV